MKIALSRGLILLGCVAPVLAYAQQNKEAHSGGFQCMSFIHTARPGGNVNLPYGSVFKTLQAAENDALYRCSQTNLAEEGWGPCETWCIQK